MSLSIVVAKDEDEDEEDKVREVVREVVVSIDVLLYSLSHIFWKVIRDSLV